VAIEGPLKELHIHDVFQLLDLGRKTGILRVTSELRQNAGVVYFDDGAVVAAEIRTNPHPLGALLLRAGKVSEEELARAIAVRASRDGQRLGDVLVEMGALTRRELDRQIRVQVEEVIFELMSWSEGYFSFEEGRIPADFGDATVRIPTESLLMEAARRIDEWSRIEAKIPHLGVIPHFTGSPDEGGGVLDLLPFEWEVLASIDNQHDIRELARGLGRSEFDVARTLFGLATAGVIVLEEAVAQSVESATVHDLAVLVAHAEESLLVGEIAHARLTAEEAVLAFPDDAAAHLALGRVLLVEGRLDEAAMRFAQALECDAGSAAARRLLGLARAGQGRFVEALEAWNHWLALEPLPVGERGRTELVERLLGAARTLNEALGGRREQ
jgi:Domain of unknown function (DUF4388)